MEVRRRYFREPFPATTASSRWLGQPEWMIEVEATVALP